MSLPPSPAPSISGTASTATAAREALPALRRAASGSRTPFTTLVGIAAAESNFRPDARNARSSATGPFQITERTWLELMKRYGAAVGRNDLAAMVSTDAEGRASVSPENRAAVLDARKDLDLSAQLTARLCDENRAGLTRKLGRAPSEAEVRLAHFLGLGGATKLIQAAAETPDVSVKTLLPKAFAHNRAALSEAGKPMTAAQAVALLDGRYTPGAMPAPRPATPATLIAQLASIAPAAAAAPAPPASPPVPDPKPIVVAENDPRELACETTANGIRCAL
jgi:hypothetical protein